MAWWEEEKVDDLLGLARNQRSKEEGVPELEKAAEPYRQAGRAARPFLAVAASAHFEVERLSGSGFPQHFVVVILSGGP
jgi:hypothetical protein